MRPDCWVGSKEPAGGGVLAKGLLAVHRRGKVLLLGRQPASACQMPLEGLGTVTCRCTWTHIKRPKPIITVIIAVPP